MYNSSRQGLPGFLFDMETTYQRGAAYVTVYPPSTLRSAPVTYLEASDRRKVTGPMRSSGTPILPCGMSDVHFALRSGLSSMIFCVLPAR